MARTQNSKTMEAWRYRRAHYQQQRKGWQCLSSARILLLASLVLAGLTWFIWISKSRVPSIIIHQINGPTKTELFKVDPEDLPSFRLVSQNPILTVDQVHGPGGIEEKEQGFINDVSVQQQPHGGQDPDVLHFYPNRTLGSPSKLQVGAPKLEVAAAKVNGATSSDHSYAASDGPYHDKITFMMDFRDMAQRLKIFVYPYSHEDPYAHAFLPVNGDPGGNYASESFFKKALMHSHFVTRNASEADLFYLPFSISRLRHDKHVGVSKLHKFISRYLETVRQKWPYWNRTAGADHFFVSCHSVTKAVSDKVALLTTNAIQAVCSSNNFLQGYVPHKDISVPQVWPRRGTPAEAKLIQQRKALAFFAGAANSAVREAVVKAWSHDQDILVYSKRLSTSYSKALLTSKFCLHVKGFEVNTARVADAVHFGCVPVILANYYDLPFADVLNWGQFSVVISTTDIPLLKSILEAITPAQYQKLQKNVMDIRKHFQWNFPPREYDAFYMVMYELWSRRHVLRSEL